MKFDYRDDFKHYKFNSITIIFRVQGCELELSRLSYFDIKESMVNHISTVLTYCRMIHDIPPI